MRVLVKVTKEILHKSADCGLTKQKIKMSKHCAIAEAVSEILPNAEVGYTTKDNVFWSETYGVAIVIRDRVKEKEFKINLPHEAYLKVVEFDSNSHITHHSDPEDKLRKEEQRRNMEPFSFEIDIPNELIDCIGISSVYKILSESRTLEHVN